MSSEMKVALGRVSAVLAICVIAGFLADSVEKQTQAQGAREARGTFEREAVQHGAATWGVTEDGERVFIWLPSAEESRKREASWRADADQILLNEGEAERE